ncbi:hypothetical protein THAOC_08888 [Thalassiosira oceanica]|uniref:Uncharacterized protein n=1 Tax=Thalassiosira oceanica TaxID=159749 RepID=K0TH86_THAOC|nr:hypothetical protein THAOC_08888 [Thalassiosira oceanica]|eukprot:EJK69817.1 hypothetical protein THAOC_08888 [Thalassiosira oceanica]
MRVHRGLQERQATTGRLRQEKKRESPPTYGPQELRWFRALTTPRDEEEDSRELSSLPAFPRFTHGSSSGRLAGAGGGVRLRGAVERPASLSAASADGGLAQVNEGNADQSRPLRLE